MTFSHRNGETDAPTEGGWYWFCGEYGLTATNEPVMVSKTPGRDRWIVWPAFDDSWTAVEDCRGQWWGPVVPPWEERKGHLKPDNQPQAQTWQPVEDGYNTGRMGNWEIQVESERMHVFNIRKNRACWTVVLPDNVRLCRRVGGVVAI